ncbi:MAG: hypothetical protein HFJ80_03740 [Clostridiales bacterium]|nr:hypothetical protein [Clostridiales bacterium]
MRYPEKMVTQIMHKEIPRLSGGVNTEQPPWHIPEHQLAQCLNLWWDRGALRRRPGLETSRDRAFTCAQRVEYMPGEWRLPFGAGQERLGRLGVCVGGEVGRYRLEVIFTDQFGRSARCGEPIFLTGSEKPHAMVMCYTVDGEKKLLLILSDGRLFHHSAEQPDEWKELDEELYVPLVMRNGRGVESFGHAISPGEEYESYNMLNPRFRVQFTTDDQARLYRLPCRTLDRAPVKIRLRQPNGAAFLMGISADRDYTFTSDGLYAFVNRAGGYLYFNHSGVSGDYEALTGVSGMPNNLEITAEKTWLGNREKITGMRFYSWYGGDRSSHQGGVRLFLAGNPAYPNLVHWSDSGEPLYFPQENSSYVGDASQAVTAFGRQGKSLVILKEREIYAVTYAARTTASVAASFAYFPITQLHTTIGCDCPRTVTLWNDRLTWMDRGKIYALKSASTAGESVVELSRHFGERLLQIREEERREASAVELKGRYWLLAGERLFVLDIQTKKEEAACYEWELPSEGMRWENLLAPAGRFILIGCMSHSKDEEVRFHYDLKGKTDIVPSREDYSLIFTEHMVHGRMETGGMGLVSDRYKRIRRIVLHVPNNRRWKANVQLVTERERYETVIDTGEQRPGQEGVLTIGIPARLAAFRNLFLQIESAEEIAIEGIGLEYRHMGGKER